MKKVKNLVLFFLVRYTFRDKIIISSIGVKQGKQHFNKKTIKDQRAYEGLVLVCSSCSLPLSSASSLWLRCSYADFFFNLRFHASRQKQLNSCHSWLRLQRLLATSTLLDSASASASALASASASAQLSSAVFPMFSPDSQPMRKFEAIYLLFAIAICRLPCPLCPPSPPFLFPSSVTPHPMLYFLAKSSAATNNGIWTLWALNVTLFRL